MSSSVMRSGKNQRASLTQSRPAPVNFWLFCGFAVVFGLAFLRVHYRVQTILTGYKLGELKQKEAELLERRSILLMNYARLTTRHHLELMANDKAVPDDVTVDQLPLAAAR